MSSGTVVTILLRFRDLKEPSIEEHRRILDHARRVWWGWWKKPNEPERVDELKELAGRLKEGPVDIGLFDRSQQAFYVAALQEAVYATSNDPIPTPDVRTTPAYYAGEKLPAWFCFVQIERVDRAEFARRFTGVPVEDYTLFPLRLHRGQPQLEPATVVSDDVVPLPGSTVVHLTDVHFGADFGFPPSRRPGGTPLLEILADDVMRIAGGDVGLLVLSGDLTSRGEASHLFNNAVPFLHTLSQRLKLDERHVVIVPGNHDISFQDFALTYDHEAAFNAFLEAFYGVPTKQVRLLRYALPTGRLLELLTMSSVKLRNKETYNYGWVDWQGYEELLTSAPTPSPDTLRVAVLHHHLVSALRDERLPDPEYPYGSVSVTLNAGAVIEGLQRHGFSLVLHGHQHTPAVHRISRGRYQQGSLALAGIEEPLYVVAGGSAGATVNRIDGDLRENCYGLVKIQAESLDLAVRQYGTNGNPRDLFTASLPLG